MVGLPVVCDTCHRTWLSNAISLTNSSVTISNVMVGPCPYCGGTGRIPDGDYSVGDAVRTLRCQSVSDLVLLRSILHQALRGEIDSEQVQDEIRQKVPTAEGLLGSKSGVVGTWIEVVLAVIAILMAMRGGGSGTTIVNQNEVTVVNDPPGDLDLDTLRELIDEVERQEGRSINGGGTGTTTPAPTQATSPRVPRNSPCPCGSGKKFKYCHG